ncbi:MAG TPA: PilZ domain-containing protein [Burkholderiales bacterium]|nr:PilZ domain-containing protein [Burkholderiales bacterium]
MHQPELRAEPRVALSFPGTLILGDKAAPCVIQNMCSRGFLIKHTKGLPSGEVMQLHCELYPARSIDCKVQVRHVNAESLGARVIEISDEGRTLCQQFLAERRAPEPRDVTK